MFRGTRRLIWMLATALLATLAVAVACGDDEKTGTGAGTATTAASPAAGATYQFDCDSDHPGTTPDAQAFPVEVADDTGVSVTLEEPPKAIAALSAGHTEMLYAMAAGDQLIAADNFSDCPAAAAELEHLDSFEPSVEAIIALAPDLVIMTYDPGDIRRSLEDASIPTFFVNSPESVDGVYDQIRVLGDLTGHVAESEALVTNMRDAIQEIEASIEGAGLSPSVFHEVDTSYYSAGPGSFVADLYDILGVENIATATGEPFPLMNEEAIIDGAPDVIILADEAAGESAETVKARAGWDSIPAVQGDRIYAVDPDIISRPGPRLVEAIRTLAKLLYPDEFP